MKHTVGAALLAVVAVLGLARPTEVRAQITTGTVLGTVNDAQGGAIPGATVVLISETRGTRSAPVVTSATGDFAIPNVTGDTYTVEVTMDGFKTITRQGVPVSGGDRVSVPALTLEVGGRAEVITVTGEAALIQAQSGERSAVVSTEQVENLPIAGRNFTAVLNLVPGVTGTARLGGGGQNNIMMDGISAMDTGNNGQMLQMNMDAIQEVKVLTQGYQAEYGRSSGLQISAVTKSGTNRFRGSVYEIRTDSDWNSVSWANQKNGTTPGVTQNDTFGYTIGGPIGKPGGANKMFFFYSHEFRPTTSGGNTRRFRMPTERELAGDFSQSTNNNGNPINQLYNAASGLPRSQCTGTVASPGISAACFPNNQIPGMPYTVPGGISLLNWWKSTVGVVPNISQDRVIAERLNYNYETVDPVIDNLTTQPAVRFDYQVSSNLRLTAKYAGQRQRVQEAPGSMPGFNTTLQKFPFIHNISTTINYTLNPTTFIEGTWGMVQNRLGAPPVSPFSNRFNSGLGNFPLLYPEAGKMDPRYYEAGVLEAVGAPFYDAATNMMNLPPLMTFGNLISNAPPSIAFPEFLNINRTNDVSISLTKVQGAHTIKTGFYLNHSYKAQNRGSAATSAQQAFQGVVDFGQDSNNSLDTGFGYANAYLGIFREYVQSSRFVEGSFLYDNIDWYAQDNWRVNSRLTFDYGLRFVSQKPQYDQYNQSSNFFPDQWSLTTAPALYQPGCAVNTVPCPGASVQARNPVTGQLLGAGTGFAIGTLVPGLNEFGQEGDPVNGVIQAGQPGNSKYNYTWPAVTYAPRLGAAYDLTGDQQIVVRGSYGVFFDRPNGNTVFNQVGNPPLTENPAIRYSTLQDLSAGIRTRGASALNTFEYESDLSRSDQWNVGVQVALPWASSLDVSYVGQHASQGLANIDINSIDFGTAFLPSAQDPTQTPAVNGSTARPELLRPYRGYGAIQQNTTFQFNTYHSLQASFSRRFRNGVSFGLNYTAGLSDKGSGPKRLEHYTDGAGQVFYRDRADQGTADELLGDRAPVPHVFRGNFVWDLPDYQAEGTAKRVVAAVVNDWQLSGVWSAQSGGAYDIGFSYNQAGANINLTGSPNYGARTILMLPDNMGSGCSSNQYAQFNNSVDALGSGLVSQAFRAPTGPAVLPAAFASYYGVVSDGPSVGLESGNNYLRGCFSSIMDLSLVRMFRLGGGRSVEFRVDAFNVFDTVVFNGRDATLALNSPTNPTMRDSQLLADGTPDPAKLKPQDAGFGAVTSAAALRTIQAQIRFSF
jgi:hypothetical protein